MTDILDVHELHKSFRRGHRIVRANDGLSLLVGQGQVMGVLGHNGAGKTTLAHQIVGLLRPDRGSIRLAGVDAIAHPELARQLTSVQAQANVPITGLTPLRAIQLVGRIRGGKPASVRTRSHELVEALDLGPWAEVPAEKISGGIARLTAYAMCAVVPGQLVILDEPTNDVDPVRRRLLWEQIRELAKKGAGVLLVTHNVREAEGVVDRLVILDHGQVIAEGTPSELVSRHAAGFKLEVDTAPHAQLSWPQRYPRTRRDASRSFLTVPAEDAAPAVQWAAEHLARGSIRRYELSPTSLEDVYVDMVSNENEQEKAA
ncbi:ABC-2 type transport system ATP-binding protein [Propionibacterium cyclohexanicum]|uniref:ABC-2 type transport system ATP-binding protein n=1 Tax=Propionibacterium cyclohexanicum TaxID=64702 RepID=A0A1H9RZ93_9ACTN|nr:ABC transporter ATP-binding protein [Propionibacterium cyclohexanicum]SER78116.1 ABC-2 type transport system ATP-binding protein [Propionibacterium cyclohexanicum]